jgi:hypothetical protein
MEMQINCTRGELADLIEDFPDVTFVETIEAGIQLIDFSEDIIDDIQFWCDEREVDIQPADLD